MKLLGSTKIKIIKNENGENVPHLEIPEVFVHYNIVNNDYQHDLWVVHTSVSNKSLGQLLDMPPKNFIFKRSLIQSFHILKHGLLIKILNC